MAQTKIISNKRACVTKDGKLVPENHPDAHVLVAVKGGEVPPELVAQYGITQKMVSEDWSEEETGAVVEVLKTKELEAKAKKREELEAENKVVPNKNK